MTGAGKRLEGRRILITGAASGIGLATAELSAEEGARVAMLDLQADVHACARRIEGAVAVEADVSDEGSVVRAVASAAEALGGLDGVVNSAGIVAIRPLAELTLEDWERLMGVNLRGVYLVCRAALPWLRNEAGATIVNISSNQALAPAANLSAYAASKAGMLAFTKSLAAELAPAIRVNGLCPGSIETPMQTANSSAAGIDPTRYALQRIGEAREVAQGVLYLTSAESSYVTGIALAVDGGRTYH